MNRQLFTLAGVFVACSVAGTVSAQKITRMAPIPGAIKNAGTYHVATGEWVRSPNTFGVLMQDALYRNDIASNYFGLLDQAETFLDEGRLPGQGAPLIAGGSEVGTSDRYTITGFSTAYCALGSTPTQFTISFIESYAPCTNPAGLPVAGTLVASGLPANGCWIVAFDLTGTTLSLDLAADGGDGSWDNSNALDDFGHAINIDAGQGQGTGQQTTGPILAGDLNNLASIGDGTVFKNPGNAGTGLGSEDLFWLESPTTVGCFFFGGCFPCANLNMTYFGEATDGPGVAYCAPGNPNSVSPGGGTLASLSGYGTSNATFAIRDVPAQPGILFTGPDAIDTPFGCGRRCVGGAGVIRYGPFNTFPGSVNDFNVAIDMTLSANTNTQYWYRDPDNASCGATFNLTNALQ